MINLCFLSGKVINEIDLKFVYNSQKRSLDKKHTSIAKIELELQDGQIIQLHAYNEMADYVFRYIKKDDYIFVQGEVKGSHVVLMNYFCKTTWKIEIKHI